jgi:hypothetical protein
MAETQPIRVLLVDDHTVVRSGLGAFLLAFDDLELIGEASQVPRQQHPLQTGRIQPHRGRGPGFTGEIGRLTCHPAQLVRTLHRWA